MSATVAAALVATPLVAARVEIVLDASGSMRGAAAGTSKMEAAKEAVRATVGVIDPSSNVALRLYGHRLPSEPWHSSTWRDRTWRPARPGTAAPGRLDLVMERE